MRIPPIPANEPIALGEVVSWADELIAVARERVAAGERPIDVVDRLIRETVLLAAVLTPKRPEVAPRPS